MAGGRADRPVSTTLLGGLSAREAEGLELEAGAARSAAPPAGPPAATQSQAGEPETQALD